MESTSNHKYAASYGRAYEEVLVELREHEAHGARERLRVCLRAARRRRVHRLLERLEVAHPLDREVGPRLVDLQFPEFNKTSN